MIFPSSVLTHIQCRYMDIIWQFAINCSVSIPVCHRGISSLWMCGPVKSLRFANDTYQIDHGQPLASWLPRHRLPLILSFGSPFNYIDRRTQVWYTIHNRRRRSDASDVHPVLRQPENSPAIVSRSRSGPQRTKSSNLSQTTGKVKIR